MPARERIYLSPPDIGPEDYEAIRDALDSGWIAPVGPHLDAFEADVAERVGAEHAVALTSGTAAIHLAVKLAGVERGDEVLVSDFTFCASVNPILYEGGVPVFVDAERESWNLDPNLVEDALRSRAARGKRQPKALIAVHLYGQSANLDPLVELCDRYGVTLIEDAAEALGATYRGRSVGTFGKAGVFSFNGNKIITTSGGGMLVTDDAQWAAHARKLATQAREPVDYYEHREIGHNYRLSNILAALGSSQLRRLEERIGRRKEIFAGYRERLDALPGLAFMPEAAWGEGTKWLTCLTISEEDFGASASSVTTALSERGIEARPLWKPMHAQPVYSDYECIAGDVADDLFTRGLCLPSGNGLTPAQLDGITDLITRVGQMCQHH